MIDHEAWQLAMRNRALTLSVATTGSIAVNATSTGYTRLTGSFLADGFRVGMEVVGVGFVEPANDAAKTILAVSALDMTCDGCIPEVSASSVLSVGLPLLRAWENMELTNDATGAAIAQPIQGRPWVDEQYVPGPSGQVTLGPLGELRCEPMYAIHVHAVADRGIGAPARYADALLKLFTPRTAITLPSGDVLRVRTDTGPYRGQLRQGTPGWAVVPVTIPFSVETANTI